MTSAEAYERFLASGVVPGHAEATAKDRFEFIKASWKDPEFKKRVWPHLTCFVDASNVSRWDPPEVHEVAQPKAKLERLVKCEQALRKLRYIPVMVSDGNLFHLMDDPYGFKKRYGDYPHSTAKGRQADGIILEALRKLPEATCVSRDRFNKPDELARFPDVLEDRSKFYAYRFDEDDEIHLHQRGEPMPHAVRRLAKRWD